MTAINTYDYTVKNATDVWRKTTYVNDNNKSSSNSGKSPSSEGEKTQVESAANAEKAQAILEYNTLTGDLNLRLHNNSLKVKAGKTITITGIGDYLSGQYFVESVKYTQTSSSAFEIVASVIKTGFGDNLKSNAPTVTPVVEKRSEVVAVKSTGSVTTQKNPNGYVSTAPLRDTNTTIVNSQTLSNKITNSKFFGSTLKNSAERITKSSSNRGGTFGAKGSFGGSK